MTAAKHTPGPWYAIGPDVYKDLFGKQYPVAACDDWSDDTEHNARLIAAAPELLDALRDAMQAVEVFHGPIAWEVFRDHSPEMKRWRAAIAKATGEAA